MKNLRWYQHLLFWLGIIGLLTGPWLFTRPYIGDWNSFDFSGTGEIGDTIGGVTAPIVGLISILLLWWTLRAQLEFNEKQDRINKEQKKFNDASRVLSMQAQVMQIDDSIRYGYSIVNCNLEGRGSASLKNLQKGTPANVSITYEVLLTLLERVHMLDVSVSSLVNVANESDLTIDEKKAVISIALVYIGDIMQFYEMSGSQQIDYLLPINELGNELIGELPAQERINMLTQKYTEHLQKAKNICDNIINA